MGRNRRSRNQEVEEGPEKGRDGRPLLDVKAQGNGCCQGQERTDADEQDAGDQPDMQARNRKQMSKPRIPHGGQDVLGNRPLLVGHEGGRHGPGLAGKRRRHPVEDLLADLLDPTFEATRFLSGFRLGPLQRPDRKADGAQPVEEGVALKVEMAGRRWGAGWQEHGTDMHPLADTERFAFLIPAKTDAHTLWRLLTRDPFDTGLAKGDAKGIRKNVEMLDAAFDANHSRLLFEDRCRHQQGPNLRRRKTCPDNGQGQKKKEQPLTFP